MKASRLAAAVAASITLAVSAAGPARAEPEPSPPPAPPAPASAIDKDGTYKVGVDIMPGTYTSSGPAADSACYWKRVGTDGTLLDNALTKKSASVRIEPTDASFTTNDCQNWQLSACGTACPPPPPGPGPLEMLGQLGGLFGPGRAKGPTP
ncbi:hypothetical protein AU196_14795 [Mycobacterium sp. IS-1742]|uniref:hypothetical protein n=1 Tax=Mycobacterium sp. IS-1742 TaxID=1772285 RepID=UPI00073FB73E|nr:hypothetical protein [Mycobacterium sp. IS-1742]KUI28963.1 hypothetical protein AU196_14795 [Mycobacterium sp. IS-1742]